MNIEKYFKEMYFDVWQGNDLEKINHYYSNDFEETINFCDDNKKPVEFTLHYEDLVKQAKWQKENYSKTTISINKIVASADNHISVNFYSSSIYKKTGELRHRCVSGIWRLGKNNKINRVWAVVTPYYSSES